MTRPPRSTGHHAPSDSDRREFQTLTESIISVRAGRDLATSRSLYCGNVIKGGDIAEDIRAWTAIIGRIDGLPEPVRSLVTRLSEERSAEAARALSEAAGESAFFGAQENVVLRADFYGMVLGDELSHLRVLRHLLVLAANGTPVQSASHITLALGLAVLRDPEAARRLGLLHANTILRALSIHQQLMAEPPAQRSDKLQETFASLFGGAKKPAQPSNAAEPDPASTERSAPPGVVVVPELSREVSSTRRDVQRAFEPIAGKPVPLRRRGDLAQARAHLLRRFPYAEDVVDILLGDLVTHEVVHLRPTILVGRPGCGKTALAGELATVLDLPWTVYGCAGMADASFGGTSAQWSTARASVPLELVRQSQVANPLIVLDELEKAGTERRNGSLLDNLLQYLEPSQAHRIRDLALEVDVDLGHVNVIACVNRLDGIPWPIRDRMRVLEMPEPGLRHIRDLVRNIIQDLERERELQPGWIEPLGQDELDVVGRVWRGGSLRRLRRAVETLVNKRDLPRA